MTAGQLGAWYASALEGGGRITCGDDQLAVTATYIIEGDGSRHDAHMHELFFELKWAVYRKVIAFVPGDVYKYAMDAARNTVAHTRLGVKYTHAYRVRSGDPDTTDGNCVTTDFVAKVISDIVSGDEWAVPKQEIVRRVEETVLKLGYEVKVKLHRNPFDATFLSGAFLTVDGRWFWYPLVGRLLTKIGWTMRSVSSRRSWIDFAGTLNSFATFKYVPFLRVYIERVSQLIPEKYRLTRPAVRWGVEAGDVPPAPTEDTWDAFYQRYSLSPADEVRFAEALSKVTRLPFILDSQSVRDMVAIDMA